MFLKSRWVFFAVLICSLSTLATAAREEKAPRDVAYRLISLIKAGKFDRAARLFHYPPDESLAERQVDQGDVARHMQELAVALGPLESVRAAERVRPTFTLSIAGGDVPYWKRRGRIQVISFVFDAVWHNEGDTQLTVFVLRNDVRWEIRALQIGVPTTRPGAKDFILSLAAKLR